MYVHCIYMFYKAYFTKYMFILVLIQGKKFFFKKETETMIVNILIIKSYKTCLVSGAEEII